MKNDERAPQINELRKAMFDQIARLNDPGNDLEKELKRAHAITSVGTVIVNSVKAEIDFMRVSRQTDQKPRTKQIGNGK